MPRLKNPDARKTPPFSIRLSYADKNLLTALSFSYRKAGWRFGTVPTASLNRSLGVQRALELARPHIEAEIARLHAGYELLVERHNEREIRWSSPEWREKRARRERRAAAQELRQKAEAPWRGKT